MGQDVLKQKHNDFMLSQKAATHFHLTLRKQGMILFLYLEAGQKVHCVEYFSALSVIHFKTSSTDTDGGCPVLQDTQ